MKRGKQNISEEGKGENSLRETENPLLHNSLNNKFFTRSRERRINRALKSTRKGIRLQGIYCQGGRSRRETDRSLGGALPLALALDPLEASGSAGLDFLQCSSCLGLFLGVVGFFLGLVSFIILHCPNPSLSPLICPAECFTCHGNLQLSPFTWEIQIWYCIYNRTERIKY